MQLRITLYDEPILRQQGKLVTHFDKELKTLANDMIETMYHTDAAGLAAQQVGKALQLCVIDIAYSANKRDETITVELDGKQVPLAILMPLVLVNPQLLPVISSSVIYEEACMSFPGGIWLEISRPEIVHVKYQDVQGIFHELKCDGILSRCIQHEYDHLHGILFIDRANRRDVLRFESKLKQLKRETRDFLKNQEKKQHS